MGQLSLKACSMSSESPHCFFFYGQCRDDALPVYGTKEILKNVESGRSAKLNGYKLYQKTWYTKPMMIEALETDFVIGRVVTYPEELFEIKKNLIRKYYRVDEVKNYKFGLPTPKQVIVTVNIDYDKDEQKESQIRCISYVYPKGKAFNSEEYVAIESNDWMNRKVLTTENKLYVNNRVRQAKSGVSLDTRNTSRYFTEWIVNHEYRKGDIICIDPEKRMYGNYIDSFKFWAICINNHKSSELNKPQRGDIFVDLLLNIIPFIRIYLIQHVEGFNHQLSTFIIDYCYKPNDYWWNGCYPVTDDNAECGNLVAGIACADHCKSCMKYQGNEKDSNTLNWTKIIKDASKSKNKGAMITLNKEHGTFTRQNVHDQEMKEEEDGNIILRTNIESDIEKQKIYNLLTRNFNEAMEPLIKACIDGQTSFIYKNGDEDTEVYIGDAQIWALYAVNDGDKDGELLCALIWRYVHGLTNSTNETKLMFEVLFLSTYENVRHYRYGHRMVKEIDLYCIAKDYDLIAVAAVPGHGESFWTSNGLIERHSAYNSKSDDEKGVKRDIWLRQNMLVFDDTPLFAKYFPML